MNRDTGKIWYISCISAIICLILVSIFSIGFGYSASDTIENTDMITYSENEDVVLPPEAVNVISHVQTTIQQPEEKEEENVVDEIPIDEPEVILYETYIIKSGDTLWRIARSFYGDGNKYLKIAEDNNLSNPRYIVAGKELKLYYDIPIEAPAQEDQEIDYDPFNSAAELWSEEYNNAEVQVPTIDPVKTDKIRYTQTMTSGVDTSTFTYIGDYRITGYDPWCGHCCGKKVPNAITASGREAVINYSIGCNNLPMGTEVYIEGYGFYRVDDTGNINGNWIDIACENHNACYKVTNYNIPVYIIS